MVRWVVLSKHVGHRALLSLQLIQKKDGIIKILDHEPETSFN